MRPCGAGNSVKTWKAWDDTSRGDRQEVLGRQEVARRRGTAAPLLSLCFEKRELARLE